MEYYEFIHNGCKQESRLLSVVNLYELRTRTFYFIFFHNFKRLVGEILKALSYRDVV